MVIVLDGETIYYLIRNQDWTFWFPFNLYWGYCNNDWPSRPYALNEKWMDFIVRNLAVGLFVFLPCLPLTKTANNIYGKTTMINTNYPREVTLLSRKSLAILEAVKKQFHHFHSKHLYRITITVPLPPESINPQLNTLSTLLRQIANGCMTADGVTNRKFFKNGFAGGCYSMSVTQSHVGSYCVHYHLRLMSKSTNLQVGFEGDLEKRVHRIISSATVEFQGSTKLNSICDFETAMETLESETRGDVLNFQLMPTINHSLLQWMLQTLASEIRTVGNLYKMMHLC